jgi:hypothetical protein
VAYYVEIGDRSRSYLDSLPLSDDARARLRNLLIKTLEQIGDDLRLDPLVRHPAGDTLFCQDVLIRDIAGDGRSHVLHCVVSDAHAASGVLIVVYVELDP